jgi:tetratricopeptide (TPR) repeat protein
MTRTAVGRLLLAATLLGPSVAAAQTQATDPLLNMDAIAKALGVSCSYCHVSGGGSTDFKSDENPRKPIARQMIAMTREINARVQAATGKAPTQATFVHCVNCHRGTPIPARLSDIMVKTIGEKGAEAAVEQYRDLRQRFFAKDTYDFSEDELLALCQRLAEARPDAAIPFLQMNLEFNPRSARTYIVMSRAYVRKRDTATAIAMLNKALELEPDNGVARGYLYQLEPRR